MSIAIATLIVTPSLYSLIRHVNLETSSHFPSSKFARVPRTGVLSQRLVAAAADEATCRRDLSHRVSRQWASFELCSNKRTKSRFRGIICIFLCFEQNKMLIIPLNLDSVLLLLHNSKLAYYNNSHQHLFTFSNSLIIHAALSQPEHLILVKWMGLETQWKTT